MNRKFTQLFTFKKILRKYYSNGLSVVPLDPKSIFGRRIEIHMRNGKNKTRMLI